MMKWSKRLISKNDIYLVAYANQSQNILYVLLFYTSQRPQNLVSITETSHPSGGSPPLHQDSEEEEMEHGKNLPTVHVFRGGSENI